MNEEVISTRPGLVRRLYDWVLGWADTPYGGPALFVLAFAESSFFPIPPDVLLIALAVAAPTRAWRFALICTAGSVLGGIAGYAIGVWAFPAIGQPLVELYHGQAVMDKIAALYAEHGFLGILIAAITPIPYKVFTISSGFFGYNFWSFVAASVVGRAFRFFLVATLIKYFGPAVKVWIEKNFNLAVTALTVLLVAGFLLVKVVLGH
jgi:membrane protein YqaA with SNARE-associated domain